MEFGLAVEGCWRKFWGARDGAKMWMEEIDVYNARARIPTDFVKWKKTNYCSLDNPSQMISHPSR